MATTHPPVKTLELEGVDGGPQQLRLPAGLVGCAGTPVRLADGLLHPHHPVALLAAGRVDVLDDLPLRESTVPHAMNFRALGGPCMPIQSLTKRYENL